MASVRLNVLAGLLLALAVFARAQFPNQPLAGINAFINDIPGAVRVQPLRAADSVKPIAPIQVPGVTDHPVFFTTLVQPQIQVPPIPLRPAFTIG